eukprot:scaffold13533_cov90-Skeletonema_dohrnii-CCMP3373.AAC.1
MTPSPSTCRRPRTHYVYPQADVEYGKAILHAIFIGLVMRRKRNPVSLGVSREYLVEIYVEKY